MRLTNYMRDAFVRAVMNDLPQVNYHEQKHQLILDAAIQALPEDVRRVYENPDTRHYLNQSYAHHGSTSVWVPGIRNESFTIPRGLQLQLNAIQARLNAQLEKRRELEAKLDAAARSATTRKALATLLPEFEKYLPADTTQAVTQNLPAVCNVVAEFTAAGWPKAEAA